MARRSKISAPFGEFEKELSKLIRLDQFNQSIVSAGSGRPKIGSVSDTQLFLLNEGVFFSAFRSFEIFVEEIFILYSMQKPNLTNKVAKSHLSRANYDLNRNIIKGGQRFIDWASPDTILTRAELYFSDGEPIKSVISTHLNELKHLKWLRNHIAHKSEESLRQYKTLLRDELLTIPVNIPSPGKFLNTRLPADSSRYFLEIYLEKFNNIARALVS